MKEGMVFRKVRLKRFQEINKKANRVGLMAEIYKIEDLDLDRFISFKLVKFRPVEGKHGLDSTT